MAWRKRSCSDGVGVGVESLDIMNIYVCIFVNVNVLVGCGCGCGCYRRGMGDVTGSWLWPTIVVGRAGLNSWFFRLTRTAAWPCWAESKPMWLAHATPYGTRYVMSMSVMYVCNVCMLCMLCMLCYVMYVMYVCYGCYVCIAHTNNILNSHLCML